MTQKEQAQAILTQFGLLEYLNTHCGTTHVIGSYAMDLMVANDLDVDVENHTMSQEKLYDLTAFINKTFHPSWLEAKQSVDKYGAPTWFCGFEFTLDGALWNVDLWFLDECEIKNAEYNCKFICKQIAKDPSLSARILEIKKGLIERNLYGNGNYTSTDVYDAALYSKVGDVDEFLRLKHHGRAVERYVQVRFQDTSFGYTYKCDNMEVEVGDVVDAPVSNCTLHQPALVKKIEYLADNQLPIPKERILALDKIISKQDVDFIFDRIGFIKSKIDAELIKEWHFEGDYGYYKKYLSSFGAELTYQPEDGVTEFQIGNILDPNTFMDYINISGEYFDDKIRFLETLLSQLYYGIITDDQFYDAIDRMTGGIRNSHPKYVRK